MTEDDGKGGEETTKRRGKGGKGIEKRREEGEEEGKEGGERWQVKEEGYCAVKMAHIIEVEWEQGKNAARWGQGWGRGRGSRSGRGRG